MATHARGLICLSLTARTQVERLGLPMMARTTSRAYHTAFTVSIEAREGVTTGISAADRARTIAVAIDPGRGAATSSRPATSSRCAPATAACWSAWARPRARSTSRGSPASIPPA
jgi:3,4-dihydroxy-2-butanone 4-phosphate synthase